MSETIWREDPENPNYQWAVEKWKLRHRINGGEINVADEWDVEMGTPDNVRVAIREAIEDSAVSDVTELVAKLLADVDRLEKE